jgi:lysyl-tRNA synthetase class 2
VEKRYRQRYVDMLSRPEVRDTFRLRSAVVSCLRRALEARGFLEVETPVLQAEAGGAEARPFATYHNALGRQLTLRIATELHLKRMVVGGFERVFELGRVFRNEGVSTLHNPGVHLVELYQAYADRVGHAGADGGADLRGRHGGAWHAGAELPGNAHQPWRAPGAAPQ